MTFWFGKPAQGLVALPPPLKGLTPTVERAGTIHISSSGGRQVDLAPRQRRTFTVSWAELDPPTYSVLEEFFVGARGPGPFVLLDPGRRNHLAPNQSGATSQLNDPTGFAVLASSGEFLASATGPTVRGPRSLRWLLPATVTSGVLDFTPPPGLVGWPTPAGQPWTFSGQISAPGQTGVTVTPALSWRRQDGTEVAATLGTPVAAGAAYAPYVVSAASPPAGALYVRPQLRVAQGALFTTALGQDVSDPFGTAQPRRGPVVAGIIAAVNQTAVMVGGSAFWGARAVVITEQAPIISADVYVDQPMLDLFGSARAFTLGTGVPQVSITALPEKYPTLPNRDVQATFVEVS